MSVIVSDSGPTAGIVFGCIFAGIMMIISVILFIYELFRPDPVYPMPLQSHDNSSENEIIFMHDVRLIVVDETLSIKVKTIQTQPISALNSTDSLDTLVTLSVGSQNKETTSYFIKQPPTPVLTNQTPKLSLIHLPPAPIAANQTQKLSLLVPSVQKSKIPINSTDIKDPIQTKTALGLPGPLRNDRFSSTIPGRSEQQFEKSQFLKYYNRTEPYPSNNTVIDSLHSLHGINSLSDYVFASIQNENDEYNAIKTYTSNYQFGNNTFYNYVNRELCHDNKTTLKMLMPFIRRTTCQIKNNGPFQYCVVYRGMQLSQQQRSFFKKGKAFRFPGFTSTSLNKDIAKSFGNTLFEIHIFPGCPQVRNVAQISHFTHEQEWLFSPYSRFKVTNIINNVIILKSLDNMGTV